MAPASQNVNRMSSYDEICASLANCKQCACVANNNDRSRWTICGFTHTCRLCRTISLLCNIPSQLQECSSALLPTGTRILLTTCQVATRASFSYMTASPSQASVSLIHLHLEQSEDTIQGPMCSVQIWLTAT